MISRNFKINISILFISIALIFIIAEILVQILSTDTVQYRYDCDIGTTLLPNNDGYWCTSEFCNKHRVNSDGFLDDDFSAVKSPDEYRIFLFGDSMIEAMQVNVVNSTHRLLESKFRQQGKNVTVYSFGVSGYGPDQYLASLKKYAPKYHPDLVIFALMYGNDLRNININLEPEQRKPFFILKNGSLTRVPFQCPEKWKMAIKALLKKSKFLVFIRNHLSIILQKQQLLNSDGIPIDYLVFQKNNPEFNQSFILNEKIILNAKKYSEQIGSDLILLTLTTSFQLDKELRARALEEYPKLKDYSLDMDYPELRLTQFCITANLSCIHLLPAFRNYVNQTGKSPHFKKDIHWNEEGNKLAAEEIFKYLMQHAFLGQH